MVTSPYTPGPIVSVIYADKMLASYDDEFCTMLWAKNCEKSRSLGLVPNGSVQIYNLQLPSAFDLSWRGLLHKEYNFILWNNWCPHLWFLSKLHLVGVCDTYLLTQCSCLDCAAVPCTEKKGAHMGRVVRKFACLLLRENSYDFLWKQRQKQLINYWSSYISQWWGFCESEKTK